MELLTGGLIALVSLWTGYGMGRAFRRAASPRPPKPRKAICDTCDHGIGYHENKTGQCQIEYGNNEICACSHYDGPIPYDTYIAQELT